MAHYVAGEHMVAAEVARLAALARATEALAAKRREISARLDRLEAAQPRSEEHANA
jgi:hypothetical protein